MNRILGEKKLNGTSLKICQGDITLEDTDAIVNAANEYLKHGGGVAFAIVRRGGKVIQEESDRIVRRLGKVPTGFAAVTTGGDLKAKVVIHAVGPVWKGGKNNEDYKLKRAVVSSLEIANGYGLKSITFPAISTGIYGFPKDRAADIIFKSIIEWVKSHPDTTLKDIRVCLYDDETARIFREAFEKL